MGFHSHKGPRAARVTETGSSMGVTRGWSRGVSSCSAMCSECQCTMEGSWRGMTARAEQCCACSQCHGHTVAGGAFSLVVRTPGRYLCPTAEHLSQILSPVPDPSFLLIQHPGKQWQRLRWLGPCHSCGRPRLGVLALNFEWTWA